MQPARSFSARRQARPGWAAALLATVAMTHFGVAGPAETPSLPLEPGAQPAARVRAPAGGDAAPAAPPQPPRRAELPPDRPATEPVWSPLARAFAASTDLRAFVAQAQLQPLAGGLFYARRALAECRLRPDTAADPGPLNPHSHRRAQAAAAQAEMSARRCAAFLPDELSDAALERLQRAGLQAGDPLLAVMHAWVDALDVDDIPALRRLMARALHHGDPALLEFMGQAASGLFQPAGRDDPGTFESSRVDHQQVWDALACELGAGCRAPRGPPDALCEQLTRCAAERFGSAPSSVPPGPAWAEAVAEVQRRVDLIRRRQGVALLTP